MKGQLLSILILFVGGKALACPDLSGFYIGSCETVFDGAHSTAKMGFGILQKDCNKFLFNETDFSGTPRFFIDGKSTLYQNSSRSLLRRASIFDGGNSVVLNESIKDGDVLTENIHIVRLISDGSVSLESETFDLAANKSFASLKCTSLAKH